MRFDPQCGFIPEGEAGTVQPDAQATPSSRVFGPAGNAVATAVVMLSAVLVVWIWRQQTTPAPVAAGATPTQTSLAAGRDHNAPSSQDQGSEIEAEATSESIGTAQPEHSGQTSEVDQADDELPRSLRIRRAGEALADGKRYLAIGDSQQAIELLAEAVELQPDLAEARYDLGLAYVLSGDTEAARRERDALQSLDRNLASLLGNLVR